jgi:hypothetical protein
MQLKTMVNSALEIAKNTLHEGKVRLSGIMHEEIDFLDSICNIWLSEGEVLKSVSETVIISSVLNRRIIRRKLGTCVDSCSTWLAINHPSTGKNI